MVQWQRRLSYLGPLAVGMVAGVFFSGQFALNAQQRPTAATELPGKIGAVGGAATVGGAPREAVTIQDALLRPYRFGFGEPTSLTQVCLQLKETLKGPVVLDLAALGRQEVDREATVQLELDGVRLKTGLKLLLDQVNLTYQVVPEDNLLIITDKEGATDSLDRIWTALQALHRDLHDVQDTIDEIVVIAGADEEVGPMVRKPTIIEEVPGAMDGPDGKGDAPRSKMEKGDGKNSMLPSPRPSRRTSPAHVPLKSKRRVL